MTDIFSRPPLTEDEARRRGFFAAWAAIAVFITLQTTINALSVLRDNPRLDAREPFIWEYSSALMTIALVPGMAWLLRLAPPGPGRWLRFGLIHLGGTFAFCLLHVGGFLAIRKGVYALAGGHYGPPDWLYEYRKDFVSYAGFLLILGLADWAAQLWARGRVQAGGPRLYHLRDGARTVRVPLEEIVAVTSARNYVEFHLAGGRKPLVRETLGKVEADLAAAGFVRTHRSWLVNPAHVRTVMPGTAGDFRLELATGLVAPLSRRFPAALATLRTPTAPPVPQG
ncbi:MAG: hypothetical protein JWP86_2932 [Phenylobacterium sp.]|nr:hypothetical protein [Phenylobacterium sp.]MDB5495595.1 hypothetical protein [Phenylobacterium sp.]